MDTLKGWMSDAQTISFYQKLNEVTQEALDDLEKRHAELVDAIRKLISEWEGDEAYMDNPDDDPIDRASGQAFGECARSLKTTLREWKEEE